MERQVTFTRDELVQAYASWKMAFASRKSDDEWGDDSTMETAVEDAEVSADYLIEILEGARGE